MFIPDERSELRAVEWVSHPLKIHQPGIAFAQDHFLHCPTGTSSPESLFAFREESKAKVTSCELDYPKFWELHVYFPGFNMLFNKRVRSCQSSMLRTWGSVPCSSNKPSSSRFGKESLRYCPLSITNGYEHLKPFRSRTTLISHLIRLRYCPLSITNGYDHLDLSAAEPPLSRTCTEATNYEYSIRLRYCPLSITNGILHLYRSHGLRGRHTLNTVTPRSYIRRLPEVDIPGQGY
ncbi:hypothetical protein J6590_073383 [Homalodisca vitripennis]|nr:hypothetical protein J6590_073383 [Homalodisca vitripennis]